MRMPLRFAALAVGAALADPATLSAADAPTSKPPAAAKAPTAKPKVEIEKQPGYVGSEYLFENAPFPSCHASTIVETKSGLAAAWFGGTAEGHPDVGIWVARKADGNWTKPVEVLIGEDEVDGVKKRVPCWNPVLFQPSKGPLLLFCKIGGSPSRWWGVLLTSEDDGRTWSAPQRLPEGIAGPIKNKPVELSDGSILCGASTEHAGWKVHFERTADLGKTWTKVEPPASPRRIDAIQPSILFHGDGALQSIGRSRQGFLWDTWSRDGGRTWTPLELTTLPNPNSGTDAVTLADGRQLLVYNPVPKGRTPLGVAVSRNGKTWESALVLEQEPGEYSYPAVVQSKDGLVHITYTWKRKLVRHVTVDPAKLATQPIPPAEPTP